MEFFGLVNTVEELRNIPESLVQHPDAPYNLLGSTWTYLLVGCFATF